MQRICREEDRVLSQDKSLKYEVSHLARYLLSSNTKVGIVLTVTLLNQNSFFLFYLRFSVSKVIQGPKKGK